MIEGEVPLVISWEVYGKSVEYMFSRVSFLLCLLFGMYGLRLANTACRGMARLQ